jgi:hypothetical protein
VNGGRQFTVSNILSPSKIEDIDAEITAAVESISRVTLPNVTDRLNMFSVNCTGFITFIF